MALEVMQISPEPGPLDTYGSSFLPQQNSATNTTQQAGKKRLKRVGRACESCRQKRLKCTDNAQPCMNCILYSRDCIYSAGPPPSRNGPSTRKRGGTKAHPPSILRSLSSGQQEYLGQEGSVRAEQLSGNTLFASPDASSSMHRADGNATDSMQLRFDPHGAESAGMHHSSTFSMDFTSTLDFDDLNNTMDLLGEGGYIPSTPESQSHLPGSATSTKPSSAGVYDGTDREFTLTTFGNQAGSRVVGLDYFKSQSSPDADQASPAGLMIWKDAENNKFIGPTSTGAIISSCLKTSIQSLRQVKESHALEYLTGAVEHVDELRWASSLESSEYWLPQEELARCYTDAYFRDVHVLYPIIDRARFENGLLGLYGRTAGSGEPVFLSLFYLVVAIGALSEAHGAKSNAQNECLSKDLYHRAWNILQDAIARPYMSSVQVLILHVIYLFHYSKSGIAWVLCGFAVRISQSLGLHRADEGDPILDPTTRRLRLQIWWTCYTLDAFLSATQGRPPAVNDSTCHAASLSRLASSTSLNGEPLLAFNIFFWHVGLARIKNRFCHLFSGQVPETPLADEVSELDRSLTRWRDAIPLEYRPDQEILAPTKFYPFIAVLHLQYFNMMSSMHWTLLASAERGQFALNEHDNPRIRASEGISVSSARSFIKVLNDISDELREEKLPTICLHTDHYMAAISVIFANIFKHSKRMSARTDLEFLRAGHHHFQRHVNPLRFNKRLKNLFQEMLRAAEEVLSTPANGYNPA